MKRPVWTHEYADESIVNEIKRKSKKDFCDLNLSDEGTPPDPQHGRGPEAENQRYTKPCPYDKTVPCVQYPDDGCCGCDPCEECEVKLNAIKPLAQYLGEYISQEWSRSGVLLVASIFRKQFEQALDAYESTEQVKIRIERV